MKYDIEAKPTFYKGIQFRSRLEAKWAAFFDYFGWEWQYEPFDLNGWSPDFLLKLPYGTLTNIDNVLVEVKPSALINIELQARMYNALGELPYTLLILSESAIEYIGGTMPMFTGLMPLTLYRSFTFTYKDKKYNEFSATMICGRVNESGYSIIPSDNPEWGEKHWYFVDEKQIEAVWNKASNQVMFLKPKNG